MTAQVVVVVVVLSTAEGAGSMQCFRKWTFPVHSVAELREWSGYQKGSPDQRADAFCISSNKGTPQPTGKPTLPDPPPLLPFAISRKSSAAAALNV